VKKIITSCFFLIFSCVSFSQEFPDLNFDTLENLSSAGFKQFGEKEYIIKLDSTVSHSGSNSLMIESKGDTNGFKFSYFDIPAKYQGEKLSLSGFIKTENVSEGFAALVLRIDPRVSFNNMEDLNLQGTNDWKEFTIEVDLKPDEAKSITFGCMLNGRGKVWFDDLLLKIDGIEVQKAKLKELLPAKKDTSFDEGSKLSSKDLLSIGLDNLELLGHIWGALKYYHPEIARGNYNWDYELFRIIPELVNVKNRRIRDQLLIEWIKSLGISQTKEGYSNGEDLTFSIDIRSFEKYKISKKLKAVLQEIQIDKDFKKNYYVEMHKRIGFPIFENENSYAQKTFPDAGFRLLALYRYWNVINYFYPYKHLIDDNWDDILLQYLPVFIEAKDELAYEKAIIKLIAEIDDSHSRIVRGADKLEESKGDFFSTYRVRFINDSSLVISENYNPLLDSVSLKVGDVITHINDKSIPSIIDSVRPFYPASNTASLLRNISNDLLRSKDSILNISYQRKDVKKSTTLQLYAFEDIDFKAWQERNNAEKNYEILQDNIGYINLGRTKNNDIEDIKIALKSTKGLIIDIRNYPSGFFPFTLGSYFISDTTTFVKFRKGRISSPGTFPFTEPLKIQNQGATYSGKIVVLVNEYTQSMAEYTTMAFQASPNTTILGSQTAGADGNISNLSLPGGLEVSFSGVGVYYPDGTETQRTGIDIDVYCRPTIEGIRTDKDEVLEIAKEIILSID